MPDKAVLRQYQALPLGAKVGMSYARIREWYDHFNGDVCVSFSGGKDSTVLAHLVHHYYPQVPLVFCNTGLEYPEIQAFARKMGAVFVRPKMSFSEVISTYGYPVISKEVAECINYARTIRNSMREAESGGGSTVQDACPETERAVQPPTRMYKREQLIHGNVAAYSERSGKPGVASLFNKKKWLPLAEYTDFPISHHCCRVMKKSPLHKYQRETHQYPFLGTLAAESKLRTQAWIRHGCNAYENSVRTSQPMSFWLEQDVLRYIVENDLEICSVYGGVVEEDGCFHCKDCQRTGCVFCAFGAHLDKGETRFQKLAITHPKQYEYCLRGGGST